MPLYIELVGNRGTGKSTTVDLVEEHLKAQNIRYRRLGLNLPQTDQTKDCGLKFSTPSALAHLASNPCLYLLAFINSTGIVPGDQAWRQARSLTGWVRHSQSLRQSAPVDIVLSDGGAFQIIRAIAMYRRSWSQKLISRLSHILLQCVPGVYIVLNLPASTAIERIRGRENLDPTSPLWLWRDRAAQGQTLSRIVKSLDLFHHCISTSIKQSPYVEGYELDATKPPKLIANSICKIIEKHIKG